jgi:tripartite ATP-independent transporter DctM subunit
MTTAIFLGFLIGPMLVGLPVAFCLMVTGIALMLHMGNFETQTLARTMIEGADSYPLLAVPFFILAGELMVAGGMSRRIVDLALALIGHVKGGLGYVAIVAAILLASISGSAVADTAALAAMLVPVMAKAGYDKARAGGLMAAGGIIGPIIPPSIPFVLLGSVTGISITKLFLGGIVPGLLLGLSLAVTWYVVSRRDDIAVLPRQSLGQVMKAAGNSIFAMVMPVIILGGMRVGVFTPTEAAVVAAVYTFAISALVYRELTVSQLYNCFLNAGLATAIVMFMVAAVMISSWLIALADLPGELIRMLEPFIDQPKLLMFLIMLALMVIGMPLDMTPTILILGPLLMPLIKSANIDEVYFGVMFVLVNCIGLITPPVGSVLNTICSVVNISMDRAMSGVMPFVVAETIVLFLLVLFPELVTLPLAWFLR